MLAELNVRMRDAAAIGAAKAPAEAQGFQVWGASVSEIIAAVLEKARELGVQYRDEIEQAAKNAVDALVALDIPGVPAVIEEFVDATAKELGYQAIEAVLDAILAGPA